MSTGNEIEVFEQLDLRAEVDIKQFSDDSGSFIEFSLRESPDSLSSFQEVLRVYHSLKGDCEPGKVLIQGSRVSIVVGSRFNQYSGDIEYMELFEPHSEKPGSPKESNRYFRVKLQEVEIFNSDIPGS